MGSRTPFLIGFLYCLTAMAVALLYFQNYLELEPCPLCILQRIAFIAAGSIFLIAALHNPNNLGRRIYAGLITLSALAGAGVAGWHVRLQNLPEDQVPMCGPGLGYMYESLPFAEMLAQVFKGSGECAELAWSFIGLSIPGWTLVSFLFLAIFSTWLLFKKT